MKIKINTDLAAGLFGIIIAALLWFPREEMGRLSLIFPRAIIVLTVLVSICLCIKAFVSPGDREVTVEGRPVRILVMIITLFFWWALIDLLGFITSTSFIFLGLVWYLARIEKRITPKAFVAWLPAVAFIVSLFYLAFTKVLQVSLPEGFFI